MGYSTEFEGSVTIEPPLNAAEVAYLRKFAGTRRMARTKGPYFVDGSGYHGRGRDEDITDYNNPPQGQPGLWCHWEPTDDGAVIEWNGTEKFYDAEEWMAYLIDHFLRPGAVVRRMFIDNTWRDGEWPMPREFGGLTFDHLVNGRIEAQGDEPDDRWALIVTDNAVTVHKYPAPGDTATGLRDVLVDIRSEALRRDDEVRAQERAEWLVSQCPQCEDGGLGPVCDDHSSVTQDEVRQILTAALLAEAKARVAYDAAAKASTDTRSALDMLGDAQDRTDAAARAFAWTLPRTHRVGVAWDPVGRRWFGTCVEPDCDYSGEPGDRPGEVLVAATQHHTVDLT